MRLIHDKADWLPKVLELNQACFSGVQRAPDAEVRLRFNSPDCSVFILRTSLDELLGFAICERFVYEQPRLVIIAVLPNYQRLGIGKKLLDEVIEFYRVEGCQSLTLTVNSKNSRAIRMYENAGFKRVSLLKKYFLQDGDGILMRRELEGM
jgi:ribosomal protein S18 acetylase RimI-like enzyme